MRPALVSSILAFVLIAPSGCGPSLTALGPTAHRHASLLRGGPPTFDGVQAYRLRPDGNREEAMARLGRLRDQGLGQAILKALPEEAQKELRTFEDDYGFDPMTQGGTAYLWENNRTPDGKKIPKRLVLTSDGETLRRFLEAFAGRKDVPVPFLWSRNADLIWLAPLDGSEDALLAPVAARSPAGAVTLVRPSRRIHLLSCRGTDDTVALYTWPGGLIVSTRGNEGTPGADPAIRGLVDILEDMRSVAGAPPADGEPGALLPDLRVVIDRHEGGMVLDLRVGKTVLLTGTLPVKIIGGEEQAKAFATRWDALKETAARSPEALKAELELPEEYADLLALLLVHSTLHVQPPTMRITAEVELDLLLSTLLKVHGK